MLGSKIRRGFLASAGAIVATVLVGTGVTPALAQDVKALPVRTVVESADGPSWTELQALLPQLAGQWTAPPEATKYNLLTDAALLGNGDMGVAVGGDRNSHMFMVSKSDFWTTNGGEGVKPIMIGGLVLRKGASATNATGSYSMTQDILNAEVRSSLSISNAPIATRSYVAASENLLVTEVTTTGQSPVQLGIDLWGQGTNGAYPAAAGVVGNTLWASRATQSAAASQWVSRVGMGVRVLGATITASQPSWQQVSAEFTVTPGTPVTIVTALTGGKNATSHVADAQAAAAAVTPSSLTTLQTTHRQWWKDYWLKSSVRTNDPTLDKYYYGSQYIMGSTVRPGKTAPGLFGNWITTDDPAWNGDYHMNYNHEAPFYGVFSSNRVDYAEPYTTSILDYAATASTNVAKLQTTPVGSGISQAFKDAIPASTDGYLYPVGLGPWGSTSWFWFGGQPSNASYPLIPMVNQYEYAPDQAFLQNKLYPHIVKVADFWEDYLGAKGADGLYHVWGAGFEEDWTSDSGIDLASLRFVFSHALEYSQKLGLDASRRAKWQDILDHLRPIATTTYNGKPVYNIDYARPFSSLIGRTITALEFAEPFGLLNLDSPAADRERAINTMDAINSWGQHNNFAKSFGIAAHIGYPAGPLVDKLKTVINERLRGNLTVYNTEGGIETTAAVEAINALMLQSVNNSIRIFPNYPQGKAGSFRSLRAKGGFLVSADYDGSVVSNVSLSADNAGGPVTVRNPWPGLTMNVTTSSGTVATTVSGQDYTFTTAPGVKYVLTPSGVPGSITGTVAASTASVNLTTVGATDWAHWGLTNATTFTHKSGTSSISNFTSVGANPVVQTTGGGVTYSWTDGTPTASSTGTTSLVFKRSQGNGFEFTVPAGTTSQRLRVYVGAWAARGKLTATLSDGSALPVTTTLDSPGGNANAVMDLTFRAGSANKTLTVRWVNDQSYSGTDGNIRLDAAVLSPN